uniref:Uncharacterized protein n=1 Tax=Rhizophora mucronata TaxID=61149 RepID=A0A2P2QKY8_RHIMU
MGWALTSFVFVIFSICLSLSWLM